MKKIGRIFGSMIVAFSLSFAFWYFLLAGFPDPQVQGVAAPAMSKEEALILMNFHGTKTIYAKNGEWVFTRNGKTCKLHKEK